MTNAGETIRVAVDPKNPGQFFACCGLLELASRFCPDAQAWFRVDEFLVSADRGLKDLIGAMIAREPQAITILENGLEVKPIIAPLRIHLDERGEIGLTLDSWMRIGLDKGWPIVMGNSPWNFWSGQQTSLNIWSALANEMKTQLKTISNDQLAHPFNQRILLKGRFGFDPGAAWDALDAGFSPNAQNLSVASSPAVELLAAVGIQRFRPLMLEGRQSFNYALWSVPLPVAVAACAAATAPVVPDLRIYRGQVVSRGQYAALGRSTESF